MGYAVYLENTHDLNIKIDSLSTVSMFLHDLGATGKKKDDDKKKKTLKLSFGGGSPRPVRGSQELEVDIELHAAQRNATLSALTSLKAIWINMPDNSS